MTFVLHWEGDYVLEICGSALVSIASTFCLEVEKEAKAELYPGHGYLTGTLQRSIHIAPLDYFWPADHLEPTVYTLERGGVIPKVTWQGLLFMFEVGSGQSYALDIHQGSGRKSGIPFVTIGLDKALNALPAIIQRNRVKIP